MSRQAIFIFFLFICECFGDQNVTRIFPHGKIVGGVSVPIEDFPFQVSILKYNKHNCGGTILTPDTILTAAHCARYSISILAVRAGSSFSTQGGQVLKIEKAKIHEKYDHFKFDYDIAVLYLAGKLELSDSVAPVTLVEENKVYPDGTPCITTGWGSTSALDVNTTFKQTDDLQLQKVTVPYVEHARCRKIVNSLTPRMVCAGGERGKGSCSGDSGGPLLVGNVQIGITSWLQIKCAIANNPVMYTNLAVLTGWIKEAIKERED